MINKLDSVISLGSQNLASNLNSQNKYRTGSSGFFRGKCPWARHFRAQPSTGKPQESMNNVSCRRDMTEIL